MAAEPAQTPEAVSANISLTIAGSKLDAVLTVPTAPIPLLDILPIFQSLADVVITAVVRAVEAEGRKVSCCKGCGACCRQYVPVSEVEARQLHDLVENLPEPRRSTIKARFADARRRLEEAGLLENIEHPERFPAEERRALGLKYFKLQIPCPFLEDESCSIHSTRPVVCREYLVTSPPENCATLKEGTIQGVMMPSPIWPIVARLDGNTTKKEPFKWVPLIIAPDWAETHPDESAPRPGPEWVQRFFERLVEEPIPAPPPGLMGTAGGAD
jgi:Fe-S-cluster containining protein